MIDHSKDHRPGGSSEAARAAESQAILTRIRQETEPQIGAGTSRILTDARGHFMGRDADQSDPIEVLGTRIGRLLGLGGVLVFGALLAAQLFGG